MAEADRISLLPLEIKISVLSRLCVKDAVRTSALAHSWRHLWTLLPRLRLDYCVDWLEVREQGKFSGYSTKWMERVVDLVSSLRGPILNFQLRYCWVDQLSPSLLQRLLDLLLQKGGVEKLHLYDFSHACRAVISLSGFHALKVLKLSDCHLVLPTGFRGFNLLTELELLDTQISSEDINLLIHTSTNLTSSVKLSLIAAKDPLSLNISFPLLKYLEFIITDSIERVSIISAPCLEEARILCHRSHLLNSTLEKVARITLGLVTSVAMVSSLTLGFDALKNFSLVALPFNFTFPRLRFLSFYLNIHTVDKRMYDAYVWLLKSMPFLEELEIELLCYDSSQTDRVAILMRELLTKRHDGFACLDRTVRSVAISMYKLGVTASVTMAQFFLLNAKVLKELKIAYARGVEAVPSMIEELQKLEIASSDAKVVIFDRIKKITMLCMNN